MKDIKFAKSANYSEKKGNLSDNRTKGSCKLKKAILTLVDELNIKNGSFKIYVHNGKPGVRIEIQNKVIAEI